MLGRNMKVDYLVSAHGVIERGLFYNYMKSLGYKDFIYDREEMVNSPFPYSVYLKKKKIGLSKIPTVCFWLQQEGKLKNVDEIKEILKKNKKEIRK